MLPYLVILLLGGDTVTMNVATVSVEDLNITLGNGVTTDAGANGGGITLKGASNKTIVYTNGTTSWDFSEHINAASGKEFKINGTSVLSATTLGSSVVSSSLTSVGTIATGTWNGTAVADDYIASAATWNGKQDALTFGIAQNNTVKVSADDVANGEYARFTATGLESVTATELKTALNIMLVNGLMVIHQVKYTIIQVMLVSVLIILIKNYTFKVILNHLVQSQLLT